MKTKNHNHEGENEILPQVLTKQCPVTVVETEDISDMEDFQENKKHIPKKINSKGKKNQVNRKQDCPNCNTGIDRKYLAKHIKNCKVAPKVTKDQNLSSANSEETKCEKMASYVKSTKKRDFLKLDGFLYRQDSKNAKETKVYWRCILSSCKAKVHTKAGSMEIIHKAGIHSCKNASF